MLGASQANSARVYAPWVLGVGVSVASLVVWHQTLGKLDTGVLAGYGSQLPAWYQSLSVVGFAGPLVFLGILSTAGTRRRTAAVGAAWRWPLVALLTTLPLAAVITVAAWKAPDLRAQREMHAIFERYTEQFPRGRLGPTYIDTYMSRRYGLTCAVEGLPVVSDDPDLSGWESNHFCAQVDLRRPVGHEVVGGYHDEASVPKRCFGVLLEDCD